MQLFNFVLGTAVFVEFVDLKNENVGIFCSSSHLHLSQVLSLQFELRLDD